MVEHRLAKARVASSNLVSRSMFGSKNSEGRKLERQPGRISFPAPNAHFSDKADNQQRPIDKLA